MLLMKLLHKSLCQCLEPHLEVNLSNVLMQDRLQHHWLSKLHQKLFYQITYQIQTNGF